MRDVWMGIVPGEVSTRVLALDGPGRALLKARLPATPCHPRAVETLAEAVALWCGRRVRAALAVAEPATASCATSRWLATLNAALQSPLVELELVGRARPPRERDGLGGLGDFRDVRQLLLFEVAR